MTPEQDAEIRDMVVSWLEAVKGDETASVGVCRRAAEIIKSQGFKLSTCEKERDAALGLAASWRMQYNALLQTTADNFMAPKPRGPSSMERSGKLDSEEPK